MSLAVLLSKRSTCCRLQVGSVLVSDDCRVIGGIGYNGSGSGLNNACDRNEPGNCGCIHAEQNCFINNTLPRNVLKMLFVTHAPCVTCAKMILNVGGIQSVYYLNEYRDKTGIKLLEDNAILCLQLEQNAQ